MHKYYYSGKEFEEVSPGIWKLVREISHLEQTVTFIEDYLQCNRSNIKYVEEHASEIIELMDRIKYN